MSDAKALEEQGRIFGHPSGLYTLFFAEMWERFSYYGMRALLMFYMLKGFLGYGDSQATSVYGAYTALVYMTPFIGGMLADKVLGKRIAVVIGGILMAAGHLLMTIESEWPFFFALALLIVGNGFFKPNISTTVGSLYKEGDPKRDDGFNIFYTGINLGAAISPLLCGYVGETYGWHYGFGLATFGMMVGLAVFVMPTLVTSGLILLSAVASAGGLLYFAPSNPYAIAINIFVAICLMIAAVVGCMALSRGGLPAWAGGRPKGVDGSNDWKIYAGVAVSVPIFAVLVSGFSPFTQPPKGEFTGRVAEIKTPEEQRVELVEFLTGFGVDKKFVDAVNKKDTTETKLRGKPLQLLSEDLVDGIKGKSKRIVNKAVMKLMLADKGVKVGDDETYDDVAIKFGDNKLKYDEKWDLTKLDSAKKDQLISMVEKETGLKFEEKARSEFVNPKTMIAKVDGKRKTFVGDILGILVEEVSKPAGMVLTILGLLAFGYLIKETFALDKIPRERMIAALILIFFQMLFFAFFEQAGSSLTNFADRNIDRVAENKTVQKDQIGQTLQIEPTQAQLGYKRGEDTFTLKDLDKLRKFKKNHEEISDPITISWKVSEGNVGMAIATRNEELPASIFQSFNAIFILIFAVLFNVIWNKLDKFGLNPSAPMKFGFGLIQLGLGFGAFWLGAQNCDKIGMVPVYWLALGYLLHTTGELCLSPVGLSAMTKLSPKALVSTLMGAWFLATAFSQYLAGVIAQFASVDSSEVEGFPPPIQTVNLYGDVFFMLTLIAIGSGVVCMIMSPLLKYWMHLDAPDMKDS